MASERYTIKYGITIWSSAPKIINNKLNNPLKIINANNNWKFDSINSNAATVLKQKRFVHIILEILKILE